MNLLINLLIIHSCFALGLTNKPKKIPDLVTFTRKDFSDIWWMEGESKWQRAEGYIFIILFLYRARTFDPNAQKFIWLDDGATQHLANDHFLEKYFESIQGKRIKVARCTTSRCQPADAPNCNRVFKHQTRKAARDLRVKKILKAINEEHPATKSSKSRKIIGKLSHYEIGQICNKAMEHLNTPKALDSVRLDFQRRCCPGMYHKDLQDWYDTAQKLCADGSNYFAKKKQYFADDNIKRNKQYEKNKNDNKYKHLLTNLISKKLLYYSNPGQGYWCDCGWTYSSKSNTARIKKHNEYCPIKSMYGIVPALPPLNSDYKRNMIDAIKAEFVGFTKRLHDKKCMFNLKGRYIQFDNNPHSLQSARIKDPDVRKTIKTYRITDFTATERRGQIVDDLGEGWVEIFIEHDEYAYPGNRITRRNEKIWMKIRRIMVKLKELKWKRQNNIWIVDPNKYELNWKEDQYK